jgi:hypothetical protein
MRCHLARDALVAETVQQSAGAVKAHRQAGSPESATFRGKWSNGRTRLEF